MEIIITAVVVIVLFTLTYKLIPYRDLPDAKPGFALFPKYRTSIDWSPEAPDVPELEEKFVRFGFRVCRSDENGMSFKRGQLLGDFTVKLLKLKCTISAPENGSSSLSLEAGWMIAFDTGDLWTFTSELKQKLQSNAT